MNVSNLLSFLNEYSALLLVIVTIVYVYFIYHSFKLSQRDYEVRNRPYLAITKDISLPLAGSGTKFTFKIKNAGQTPAQLLSHEIIFLKCKGPGERFSDPYNKQTFSQKAILLAGETTTFSVDNLSDEKKVGLEIKIKYKGIVFRKLFGTKVLFKLEKRMVYPIDSSVF